MRTMQIKEYDSGSYTITTTDFVDGDSIVWTWDSVARIFCGEYQIATLDKRRFQRETYDIKDYPTIGDAVSWIWRRDQEIYNERFAALVASRRSKREIDRIDVSV